MKARYLIFILGVATIFFLAYYKDFGYYIGTELNSKQEEESPKLTKNEVAKLVKQAFSSGNNDEGLSILKKLANEGYSEAQTVLATLYLSGNIVNKDDNKALELFKMAANKNYSDAQYFLFHIYSTGSGDVQKNNEFSIEWLKKSANNKSPNAFAEYELGRLYSTGENNEISQNHGRAIALYKLASEKGHKKAQFNLANLYKDGKGVPKNFVEAMRLYKKAAEQGHVKAITNIGYLYDAGGFGVAQNLSEAYKYYLKASNLGSATAQKNMNSLCVYYPNIC